MLKEDSTAIGLAAPQIGVNKTMFVIRNKRTDLITVYINPIIKKCYENKTHYYKEGCLSVPSLAILTNRYKLLKVTYLDEQGNVIKRTIKDDEAVVFQHELDHLNGVLMTERSVINSKNESGEK